MIVPVQVINEYVRVTAHFAAIRVRKPHWLREERWTIYRMEDVCDYHAKAIWTGWGAEIDGAMQMCEMAYPAWLAKQKTTPVQEQQ